MIENVLAALIILVLLGIVMYLAFEDQGGSILSGGQENQIAVPDPQSTAPEPEPVRPAQRQPPAPTPSQPDEPVTREAKKEEPAEPVQQSRKKEARKTVPEPERRRKIVARWPKSEAQPTRRRTDDGDNYSIIVRDEAVAEAPARSSYARRTPVREIEYRDPWQRTDYYECSDGWCDCSCDRPYWARSGPVCWD